MAIALSLFAACAANENAPLSQCDDNCVNVLETKALKGDADAAKRLATHYGYVNPDEVRYWEQIAAENGDADSQRALAHTMLIYSKDPRDHVRGVFWLEKAASAGAYGAVEELERYRQGGVDAINPAP